jgi:hypothetical protein
MARSTVPPSDLAGLSKVITTDTETIQGRALGVYLQDDKRIILGQGAGIRTKVHELGHHVSQRMGSEHAVNYSKGARHQGREEAFADDYAAKHLPAHIAKDVEPSAYEQGSSAHGGREFQTSYKAARTIPLSGRQFPWAEPPRLFEPSLAAVQALPGARNQEPRLPIQ